MAGQSGRKHKYVPGTGNIIYSGPKMKRRHEVSQKLPVNIVGE